MLSKESFSLPEGSVIPLSDEYVLITGLLRPYGVCHDAAPVIANVAKRSVESIKSSENRIRRRKLWKAKGKEKHPKQPFF